MGAITVLSTMTRKIVPKILSVGLALFLVALCWRQVDSQKIGGLLSQARPSLLLGASVLIALIPLIKAFQWGIFIRQVKRIVFARLFQMMAVRLMMVNLLPSWFGESLSLYWFGRREAFSPAATLSFLSLDHLADAFSLLVVISVVVIVADLPPWMKGGLSVLVIVLVFFFLVALLLAHHFRVLDPTEGGGFSGTCRRFLARWAHHLHTLRDFRMILVAIFLSLAIKGAALLALFLTQKALGLTLPFETPFLVIASIHLVTFFPLTPGNLGLFEAALFLVYRHLGLDTTQAFSLGVLCHLIFTVPYWVVGSLTLLITTLRWGKSPLDRKKQTVLAEIHG